MDYRSLGAFAPFAFCKELIPWATKMDTLSLGHLIASLEHRIGALEADWRRVKRFWRKFLHYGRRIALIVALYLANLIAHMEPAQIGSWIKWALGPMVGLLGQLFS